ncbi:MAG: family 2 glycosyl transferase [Candidatus Aramenus sulfurataquae]|jgi:dolichol-phosphate mannosyltransferase|uniref:Dolichol-phosphate mannosyltransferase n=2 Tax=Candidatus Aramenus sulfurataquae TaxID=1326980 RepID=W7KXL0_9CREN|nr:MAG: family 2 glycosyl transferase [Candidatus Aramenus sulfurataquae]MCL7343193.1 polyprenol monophosphomannose synthase [Candidatus Aramenus sulfurataquae]
MENLQRTKLISIVIPTYNERDNVVSLVKEILSKVQGNIIVVDDDSQDKTAEAVMSLNLSNVKIFVRKNERGLGSALRFGLLKALELGSSYAVTMDADFSHDPTYLKPLIEKAVEGYDLVIGSRYVKGGRIENWPLSRRLISKGANFMVRLLLKSSIHDNTSNYRVYSRQAIEKVLECDSADGYEFQICAVYQVLKNRLKVAEVPIVFKDRERGQSKLNFKEIVKWLNYVLKLYLSS